MNALQNLKKQLTKLREEKEPIITQLQTRIEAQEEMIRSLANKLLAYQNKISVNQLSTLQDSGLVCSFNQPGSNKKFLIVDVSALGPESVYIHNIETRIVSKTELDALNCKDNRIHDKGQNFDNQYDNFVKEVINLQAIVSQLRLQMNQLKKKYEEDANQQLQSIAKNRVSHLEGKTMSCLIEGPIKTIKDQKKNFDANSAEIGSLLLVKNSNNEKTIDEAQNLRKRQLLPSDEISSNQSQGAKIAKGDGEEKLTCLEQNQRELIKDKAIQQMEILQNQHQQSNKKQKNSLEKQISENNIESENQAEKRNDEENKKTYEQKLTTSDQRKDQKVTDDQVQKASHANMAMQKQAESGGQNKQVSKNQEKTQDNDKKNETYIKGVQEKQTQIKNNVSQIHEAQKQNQKQCVEVSKPEKIQSDSITQKQVWENEQRQGFLSPQSLNFQKGLKQIEAESSQIRVQAQKPILMSQNQPDERKQEKTTQPIERYQEAEKKELINKMGKPNQVSGIQCSASVREDQLANLQNHPPNLLVLPIVSDHHSETQRISQFFSGNKHQQIKKLNGEIPSEQRISKTKQEQAMKVNQISQIGQQQLRTQNGEFGSLAKEEYDAGFEKKQEQRLKNQPSGAANIQLIERQNPREEISTIQQIGQSVQQMVKKQQIGKVGELSDTPGSVESKITVREPEGVKFEQSKQRPKKQAKHNKKKHAREEQKAGSVDWSTLITTFPKVTRKSQNQAQIQLKQVRQQGQKASRLESAHQAQYKTPSKFKIGQNNTIQDTPVWKLKSQDSSPRSHLDNLTGLSSQAKDTNDKQETKYQQQGIGKTSELTSQRFSFQNRRQENEQNQDVRNRQAQQAAVVRQITERRSKKQEQLKERQQFDDLLRQLQKQQEQQKNKNLIEHPHNEQPNPSIKSQPQPQDENTLSVEHQVDLKSQIKKLFNFGNNRKSETHQTSVQAQGTQEVQLSQFAIDKPFGQSDSKMQENQKNASSPNSPSIMETSSHDDKPDGFMIISGDYSEKSDKNNINEQTQQKILGKIRQEGQEINTISLQRLAKNISQQPEKHQIETKFKQLPIQKHKEISEVGKKNLKLNIKSINQIEQNIAQASEKQLEQKTPYPQTGIKKMSQQQMQNLKVEKEQNIKQKQLEYAEGNSQLPHNQERVDEKRKKQKSKIIHFRKR